MDFKEIVRRLKDVSDTPRLDARLLTESGGNLEEKINRRLNHEPVSKIIGKKGFWKSEFITSSNVLDPRPDSETIIESVLKYYSEKNKPYRILDIGVGSGCLLFSLLDEYPYAAGVGVDISPDALLVAEQNKGNRFATLFQKDLYDNHWTDDLDRFDIIISNPPYIPSQDIKKLSPDVRLYDPIIALDGGQDGLDAYRALAQNLSSVLAPKGSIFLEIGQGQEQDVADIFVAAGFKFCQAFPDFGGIIRVVVFQKD